LGIDIKKRFSENFRKAEVLTYRANVFTLFSKTEMKILETGKHMSFSEFRTYIQSFGMVRRHSFGFALVIVLVLSLVPKPVHAKSVSLCLNICDKVIVTNCDYGEVDIGHVHFQVIEIEPVVVVTFTLEIVTYFFRYIDKILLGFYPDVGVVPRFIVQS
jgi:ethanolamine utilization protein EutA (predicted chaperonin)